MSDFRPPSSDMNFILEHVVGYRDVAALPGFEHADLETVRGEGYRMGAATHSAS